MRENAQEFAAHLFKADKLNDPFLIGDVANFDAGCIANISNDVATRIGGKEVHLCIHENGKPFGLSSCMACMSLLYRHHNSHLSVPPICNKCLQSLILFF